MGSILEQIWQLPWYKVLIVAAADDIILILKLWPIYLIVIAIGIIVGGGVYVFFGKEE